MPLEDYFPPPDVALELNPEDLAIYLLKFLQNQEEMRNSTLLNLYNFVLHGNLEPYAKDKYEDIAKVLTEAWLWLEREVLIAPKPGQDRNWIYITKRGKILLESSDLDIHVYKRGNLIPIEVLDPVLASKIRHLFIRGDYDTAVFQAFKEVEVRVRKAASLPLQTIGVDLVRQACHPESGKLTDYNAIKAEREATSNLFAGAIGLFKNPSSHRDANWEDAGECAELIYFANYLLRLIEKRMQSKQ
jgi:uncharacterized protein (TIGR02391 family)